jgi:hypothetical protein
MAESDQLQVEKLKMVAVSEIDRTEGDKPGTVFL